MPSTTRPAFRSSRSATCPARRVARDPAHRAPVRLRAFPRPPAASLPLFRTLVRGTVRAAALALASLALPFATPVAAWTNAPFETLGDDHRVREGHASAPEERAADAERAARGELVGKMPAHDALRGTDPIPGTARNAARGDAHPPFAGPYREETWVADLGVLLRRDDDGDGFFGAVDLSIDVDTTALEREVYLVVDLREPDGYLTLSHVTRAFTVRGNATSDTYRLEIELLDNHVAAYRDALIEVRDAWDDTLLDTVSSHGFASLAALPLEAERRYGPVDDDGRHPTEQSDYALGVLLTGSSSHDRHGDGDAYVAGYAGAGGPLGALVLLALTLARRALSGRADRGLPRTGIRRRLDEPFGGSSNRTPDPTSDREDDSL